MSSFNLIGVVPDRVRTVQIDFSECTPHKERVYLTYGSKAYEIIGKDGDICILKYGGHVENPSLNDSLTTVCRVPLSEGSHDFIASDLEIQFTPIIKYCKPPEIKPKDYRPMEITISIVAIAAAVFLVIVVRWFERRKRQHTPE